MNKFWLKCFTASISALTIIFMFFPEDFFGKWEIWANASKMVNIIFNRIILSIIVFIIVCIIFFIYNHCRNKVIINGKGYKIQIEYGDIFETPEEDKKVIAFDECFTTVVGDAPEEIKPNSICGQYLNKFPISPDKMQNLINQAKLKPEEEGSKYKNQEKYEPGRIVPNGNYLLMSFVKLSQYGTGEPINIQEYLDCLMMMWKEIDKYYAYRDVYIPIIGSGLTRINSVDQTTQQQLLDIIIESYRLSVCKIQLPRQLHIVCRRCDGFSFNKIGSTL